MKHLFVLIRPGMTYLASHDGKTLEFTKLQKARDFAEKQGYNGLKLTFDHAVIKGTTNGEEQTN